MPQRTTNYDASDSFLDAQSREVLVFNEFMREGRLCRCGEEMDTMVGMEPACRECWDVLTWHERYYPDCRAA